jgi:uncharacterized OB-fold protein
MPTMHQDRTITAPIVYPDSAPFWEAAKESRLLIKRCRDCSQFHWYPRTICPHCGSDATEWVQASGRGTIYSVSVTRRAGPHAYAIAYVFLEEGVTMMTNIIDCDLDTLRIGDAVAVAFRDSDGGPPVPMFRPV